MAKTLKDFLNERQLGPMVVKNPDEQKFIDKHAVAKTADRNGNDDELFKGSKVKMADRTKHRKGYNPGEDEEVYEELKGNQHKIDANKNGKVDAHDFHLLRKKKKVAEAADDAKLAFQLHMAKKREELRKKGQLAKEEAEELDELSRKTLDSYTSKAKADLGFVHGVAKNHRAAQDRNPSFAGRNPEQKAMDNNTLRKRASGLVNSIKRLAKEEAEELDELSIGTMKSYGDKRARTVFSGGRKPGQSVDAGIKMKSKQSNSLSLARTKINRARDTGSTVLNKEEIEQIDELSPSTMGSYAKKASADFTARKPKMGYDGQLKKMQNRRVGVNRALDKMYGEEADLEEKLDMKKASMGTVINDFQKSKAPQFQGRSQKKRQAMAVAAKLTAERGKLPMNKEERLLIKLADLAETHQRTMVSVFEKLNEDNQYAFMQACDTADGIEQMLDFSISYRGE